MAVEAAIREAIAAHRITADIVRVGCLGLCYAEPLVDIIKPGFPRIHYGGLDPEQAARLVTEYLTGDNPCPELALGTSGDGAVAGIPRLEELPVLKAQVRITLRNCGLIDPGNLDHYLARGGYRGLERALAMGPEAVIEEIKRSGLRGRGGAGFPTGLKWQFCRKASGNLKYLICNADEGDPGAFMDRSLLEGDPHAVLEGMLIGAYAIGASEGYIYIRAEYPLAIERLQTALRQLEENGLIGDDILGSGFGFHLKIKEGAGAFVCGEETALIASIEGKRGMPRSRPPFPANSGLWGRPTNINNVETWASVSAIMERGADWFAGYGTEKSRGTKTFALAGKINRTGLIEVPFGITLEEIIYDIGGGIPDGKQLKAVQTGGPSGGCLPAGLIKLAVDYESLAEAGSIVGSGGMIVLDEDNCMVDTARFFLSFTCAESCGKCVPCRLGTRQMLDILEKITRGDGEPADIELLSSLSRNIKRGSLCALGGTATNPVITTLRYFREEYEAHVNDKKCQARVCRGLISYYIRPDKCRGCGICLKNCPAAAINGGKQLVHIIDQEKCTRCGVCLEVCPPKFGAVFKASDEVIETPPQPVPVKTNREEPDKS